MKESSDSDGSTYQVQVEYAYKAAGVEHTNDRLAFVIGFTLIWWVASRSDNVLLQNLLTR